MNKDCVTVGDREIGPGRPCYLIAEVGTTALGDMSKALQLVEAGASAGMDAIKFQVIDPSQLSDAGVTYTYRSGGATYTENMKGMFEKLHFDEVEWQQIADACADAGVHFFATVDYVEGIEMLERIGVPAHKSGAWDSTFRPLIERLGATGKPLFADLGPTTDTEIEDFVRWFNDAGGSSILFMHDFHTSNDEEMNLRAITWLNEELPWPAGYSSPGRDDDLDLVALGLGAFHIEKRLILSRSDRAFHADESMEPTELKDWVQRVRRLERTLGEKAIRPSRGDLHHAQDYYRSICTLKPVTAGERFTPENLGGKRPGTGIPTSRLPELWGRASMRELKADTIIEEADVDPSTMKQS